MEYILIKRTPLSYFLNVHNANGEGNLWKKNKEPKVKQSKKINSALSVNFLAKKKCNNDHQCTFSKPSQKDKKS